MKNLSLILILGAWSTLIFAIGYSHGVGLSSAVVHQVEDTFQESIRTGQPFIFEGSKVRLVPKSDRTSRIVYRVHTFIWPEDLELLPMPVNKFGQYGKEWKKP